MQMIIIVITIELKKGRQTRRYKVTDMSKNKKRYLKLINRMQEKDLLFTEEGLRLSAKR